MRISAACSAAALLGATMFAPAGAQMAPLDPRDGLTVTGHASLSADADGLAFDVRIGGNRPGTAASPAQAPKSLGDIEAAPRALATALSGAGARDIAITFDSTLNASGVVPFDVRGTLPHPTHDRILSLVLSGALATMPDGSAIPVQSATAVLIVNDCRSLTARADAAAFDDAKQRAEALALHAHVRLGAVRRVVAPPVFPACGVEAQPRSGVNFGLSGIPLDGPYRVTATRDVAVTFAIS